MHKGDQPVQILVIDDERDIRDGCERILSRVGCQVTKAANGEAGLAALERQDFSLVLLDLKMPGLDGFEVLKRIRQSHPDLQVIVITGYATVETAIEAMKLGAYDFISKPFQPDQLRLTVARATEKLNLMAQARRLEQERQKTLADLDTEKSRTRTIIKALPHGVAVTAPDGRVALMNPAFLELLGLGPSATPGQPLSAYVQEPGLCDLMLRVSRGNASQAPAYEFATPHGRYLAALCTSISGEEGECLGAVMVLTDITEWKMLDRLKTEFLARVSHELRSPLSTIHLQLALLLDQERTEEGRDGRHLLARAKERTQGLIALIKDLLDISRIEWGVEKQELKEFALEDVLANVAEAFRPQVQARRHSLSLKLPEERLPPLLADQTALESVLANLIANAINYTPDGGAIEVRASQEGDFIRIDVQDNGFGIEAEYQEKIFEKFFRVKNEKTRYITGTGLGLPIVKSIVTNMGGRISVASQPGQGSTFSVFLPSSQLQKNP